MSMILELCQQPNWNKHFAFTFQRLIYYTVMAPQLIAAGHEIFAPSVGAFGDDGFDAWKLGCRRLQKHSACKLVVASVDMLCKPSPMCKWSKLRLGCDLNCATLTHIWAMSVTTPYRRGMYVEHIREHLLIIDRCDSLLLQHQDISWSIVIKCLSAQYNTLDRHNHTCIKTELNRNDPSAHD